MTRICDLLGLAVAVLGVVSCARRTDEETRAAFEAAARPATRPDGSPRDRPGRRPVAASNSPRTAWQAATELLEASITLLSSDPDATTFTRAATASCAVAPVPKASASGPIYLCFLREPIEIERRSFTLEVAPGGVIGLHVVELDEPTSRTISEQARVAVQRLCATPFTATPTNDERSAFYTCPVDGGATLAVGHARASAGPGWFVSLTVLGELRQSSAPQ